MALAPPNGRTSEWVKYLGAVSSMLLVLVVTPVGSWAAYTIIDHGKRISVIESNRFTSSDAMKVYETLAEKADKDSVPPPEVKQALTRLERDVREIRRLVEAHMTNHAGRRESSGSIRPSIVPPGEDD